MESLLGCAALELIAGGDVMLAFDFDGTLCPIVDDPARAELRPQTRRLIARAAQLYPCVVVSGRAEQDVREKLCGVTVWYAVGNGCLDEPEQIEDRFRTVRGWIPQLLEAVGSVPGVFIEDKGVSLAIHYRSAKHAKEARESIREAARLLQQVRIVPGKKALHLLPLGGAAKHAALERLRAKIGCERILYFGDDGTDEQVFAAAATVTGVRIGKSASSAATYYLRDQADVDEILARLVALRAPRTAVPERRRRR